MLLKATTVESAVLAFAILFLALNAAFKFAIREAVGCTPLHQKENALWSVEQPEVLLQIDSWTRYHISSGAEWSPLFPEGGVIHLGPSRTPYTVAMMHELRCLDVIREQISRPKADREEQPTRHCMNYLRQMVMCRGDLEIQMFQYPEHLNPVDPHSIRRCKDWRPVYEKVWELQREHSAWLDENDHSALSEVS